MSPLSDLHLQYGRDYAISWDGAAKSWSVKEQLHASDATQRPFINIVQPKADEEADWATLMACLAVATLAPIAPKTEAR